MKTLFSLLTLFLIARLPSQAPNTKLPTTDYKALGHPELGKRLEAKHDIKTQLAELSAEELKRSLTQYYECTDAEIKATLKEILLDAYIYKVFPRAQGFLGIGLERTVMINNEILCVVDRIHPKSPAEIAGIKVRDIIVTIDKQRISGPRCTFLLTEKIAKIGADRPCEIVLLRDNKKIKINVILAAREDFNIQDPSGIPLASKAHKEAIFLRWLKLTEAQYLKSKADPAVPFEPRIE